MSNIFGAVLSVGTILLGKSVPFYQHNTQLFFILIFNVVRCAIPADQFVTGYNKIKHVPFRSKQVIPVIYTSIGGCRILGRMTVGNRHGLLVPNSTTDQELQVSRGGHFLAIL